MGKPEGVRRGEMGKEEEEYERKEGQRAGRRKTRKGEEVELRAPQHARTSQEVLFLLPQDAVGAFLDPRNAS